MTGLPRSQVHEKAASSDAQKSVCQCFTLTNWNETSEMLTDSLAFSS